MRDIYPDFYREFKCIANRCEDSCCKDWDIDVDSETEKFYNTVNNPLGDKIRSLTYTDEYGERVFKSNNGKCPFWNDDMLCDIYIGLGEEHLSRTCANFPRVKIDFGDFRENILSFACPEAARFMLKSDRTSYADFGGDYELESSEYDEDNMSFLLKARNRSVGLLTNADEPFAYRLADCLEFNAQVQSLLDGKEPSPLAGGNADGATAFIFDMHKRFEIMSDTWKQALDDTAERADELKISGDFERDFEKFALYYIYRYYLEAVNSNDVMYSVKRIVCAYFVTGKMDALFAEQGYPLSRMRVLQRYSKEVEHSYDNTEALGAEFDKDNRFEAENLIALLENEVR